MNDHDENDIEPIDHDRKAEEREAHGDWLRDEMIDRQMEQQREERKAKAAERPTPDVKHMGDVTISRNGYIEDLERQLAEAESERDQLTNELAGMKSAIAGIAQKFDAHPNIVGLADRVLRMKRELAEANEKLQGMQDGIDYAAAALMREKALADRLAEALDMANALFGAMPRNIPTQAHLRSRRKMNTDQHPVDFMLETFKAWKEARR